MTNTLGKTDKRCDSCANKNVEIKRRYKNETYCASCYQIWFIKKPCSKCGEIRRLHKKEEFSICSNCRMRQPCIRCGGSAFKDGANTEYGRVCQTCYQGYFKTKKKCFECNEFKRGVSSYSKLPHTQNVCVACYQSHFRKTCPLCHKYRELINTEQGKICKKCHYFGEIHCESCNELMPAGMGKRCDECYWSKRLLHEIRVNTYILSSETTKQAYTSFINWFATNKGNMTATLKHNNFINFFARCDKIWGKIPSYESLVQEFKPKGLRENLTVLRWLIETKQIIVNSEIKRQIAEQERITNLLTKFGDDIPTCIRLYYEFLSQKLLNRKTSIKSVRSALQPAVGLCIEHQIKGSNTPTQEHINSYLLVKHGQYNALYGFVTFLNKKYKLDLVCNKPSREDVRKLKKRELEQNMTELYNKPKPLPLTDKLKWLQLSMSYFHQVDIQLKTLKTLNIQPCDEDMLKIIFNGKEYFLPRI